ncbi:MAG: TadE/TadG family type IV pilus assembly protein [Candidatus Phosphoribacter sp.]
MVKHGGSTERGASAVELAIVLPVLLLVLGGIIDFGRAFAAQLGVTQGATAGARMVALNYSTGDVSSRVSAAALGFPVTTTVLASCPAKGTPISTQASSVRVDHVFSFLIIDGVINLFGAGLAPTLTLSSTGSMRCTG